MKTNEIQNFDNRLAEYNNILTDINFQLQDLSRDIMNYIETLELDQDRLNFLEERIDTVNNLKIKYGNTIEEIYKYKENIEKELIF